MKRKFLQLIAQVMKKPLQITAVLDKPDLLENLVEKLAERRIYIG